MTTSKNRPEVYWKTYRAETVDPKGRTDKQGQAEMMRKENGAYNILLTTHGTEG